MTRQTVSVYKSCFGLGSPPETRSVLVCSQKLKDVESIVKIVELNGDDLVKDYSDEIERMLGSKMKSVKVRTRRRLQSKPVCTGWMDQCTDQQKPSFEASPFCHHCSNHSDNFLSHQTNQEPVWPLHEASVCICWGEASSASHQLLLLLLLLRAALVVLVSTATTSGAQSGIWDLFKIVVVFLSIREEMHFLVSNTEGACPELWNQNCVETELQGLTAVVALSSGSYVTWWRCIRHNFIVQSWNCF